MTKETVSFCRSYRVFDLILILSIVLPSFFVVVSQESLPEGAEVFLSNIRVDDTGSDFSNQMGPSIALSTNGTIYVA